MRHDQTDARLRHGDDQSPMRPPAQPGTGARALGHPMNAAANVRATVWLIACLLLVWAAIVVA